MSAVALAGLVALGGLTGDWEGSLAARINAAGGASPLDASSAQVAMTTLEVMPRAAVRWMEGSSMVELAYTPRLFLRYIAEPVTRGSFTSEPGLEDPTWYQQGELSAVWQVRPTVQIQAGVGGGVGQVSFADALGSGQSGDGITTNITAASLSGRLGLSAVTVPRGDTFTIGAQAGTDFTLTEGAGATARDRTRLSGTTAYLWQPTPVNGFEVAATAEISFYPVDSAQPPGMTSPTADQAAFSGFTVGWVPRLTRRTTCALRAGVVLLFNSSLGAVPSASGGCSIITYQSPGLRVTTAFDAGFVGGTSALDAVAEPRFSANFNLRAVVMPDKSLGLGVAANIPFAREGETTVPSTSSVLLSLPFSWQLDPGIDFELSARLGLRGVIDPGGAIPAGTSPFTNFGDTFDAQIVAGLSVQFDTVGDSRYQR